MHPNFRPHAWAGMVSPFQQVIQPAFLPFQSPFLNHPREELLPSCVRTAVSQPSFCSTGIANEAPVTEFQSDVDNTMKQLKDQLTASQYELLEDWLLETEQLYSSTEQYAYHHGIKAGMKLADQLQSVSREGKA